MFDDYKKKEEMNSSEMEHYEYERDDQRNSGKFPYEPQDHKKKKHSSARNTGIAAAVALVFGVVAGAGLQLTGNLANRVDAAQTSESGSQIEAAGTVNEKKATGSEDVLQNVSQEETTADSGDAQDEIQTAETMEESEERGSADTSGNTVADVAENSMPFMVAITNQSVEQVEDYFSRQTYQQEVESTGSGVIFDENEDELLIVTNNHVVEGAESLSVLFSVDLGEENQDDAIVEGLIKGTDSSHDLAVVAVKLEDIPEEVKSQIRIASIGDSSEVRLGEQVVAIGNALGYGQSVTSGYVSALNREVTVDGVTNYMIQTDAAINAGNSGGALLNMNGELIGINSVKASATGVEGMGYAIPSDTIKPILENLKNMTTRTKVSDSEEQGFMGITPYDVSDEAKELYNVPTGAYVYSVEEGSAADEAGLKRGDIITKIDGVTISSREELFDRMEYYRAGETITLTVQSVENGSNSYQEKEVTLTLGTRPDSESSTTQSSGSDSTSGRGRSDSGSDGSDSSDGEEDGSVSPFSQMFPDLFN
ncbi:MAG: trypsin-like peptidase domain-containing protein [Eubacteriales bacterium]|nr:trypsin-like peptidase domain-containing protein [Eubacteriales bacterium]